MDKCSDKDLASAANRRPVGRDPIEHPPPAVYPGRMPLEGPRVRLEAIDPRRHAAELYAIGHASEAARGLWEYMPYGPFESEAAMGTWIRTCAAAADPVFFAIRETRSAALSGMASFLEIRPLIGVVEIGHIWFAPPFQRSAAATEALYLLMAHAMDDLENRRLEWKCNAQNEASRRAALRLGFRYEGVFYNHLMPKGRNRDTAYYSLIDSEWPAVRSKLSRWLSPENFDGEGRQRESLSALNEALW